MVEYRPAGQGWRGGFYVVYDGKPLLGPFDNEQEANDMLVVLRSSQLVS